MNGFQKMIRKDRYGVVRGALLLGAALLLCACLFLRLFVAYNYTIENERVSTAADRVADQFRQLVDNGLLRLTGAAEMIAQDSMQQSVQLEAMLKYGAFSDAAVLKDGVYLHADGIQSDESVFENSQSISYSALGFDAECIVRQDGSVELRAPMQNGSTLCAWLDAESVARTLDSAFNGDYGYALYNISTGEYLIRNTLHEAQSDYDALPDFGENGGIESLLSSTEGQALVNRGDAVGGACYIAQKMTGVGSIGIFLTVPVRLVHSGAWISRAIPWFIISTFALLLALLIAYTVFALRRVRTSDQNASRALEVAEQMMGVISREAHITLCIHRRGREALTPCYDGLHIFEDGNEVLAPTMSELERVCGMDNSESDHLRDCLRELQAGDSTELLVRCATQDQEERILRFALLAMPEPEQGIICCIGDCTLEQTSQNRAELERSYQASIQSKTSSIWQIDVSRNRWTLLFARKRGGRDALIVPQAQMGEKRLYSEDLDNLLRDYIHPADHSAYEENMSLTGLSSAFRSGRTEFVQEYRVCRNKGADYEWHRMRVRIWLDPNTNDVLANLYVFNVDAEKNAELERGERKRVRQQTLMALSGLYYALYYVDLENDLSYTARSLGGDLATQLCVPYKATFDEYIASFVHPEDQEAMRTMISAYHLRRNMTEGSHFRRMEYRHRAGDDYEWAVLIVQPARFENGCIKEAVLAIRYTGREKGSALV